MIKYRQQMPKTHLRSISSFQVDRFLERMRLVGEGETRLLVAIESNEETPLSASLTVTHMSKVIVRY